MEIARSRYGKTTWTLRDGKWVRPETGEVDSRPHNGCEEICATKTLRVNVGARPRPGENCYKPSEDLLRQLNAVEAETKREAKEKRREAFMEMDRDFDIGKRKMDADVHLGTPTVAVPEESGAVRYVRADKVPEADQARLAASRRAAEQEVAKAKAEAMRAAPSMASFEGRFENTIPAPEPSSVNRASLERLDPATARNDAKRIWS